MVEPPVPERLIDLAADIYLALKEVGRQLDRWNTAPRTGRIFVNGVLSMTTATPPIDIPTDPVPAVVEWRDRLDTAIPHDRTTTTWSAEDANGQPSTAVTVDPNLDSDSDDETATITFQMGTGQFKVVATTPSASQPNGVARAESALYNIVPGAPVVGTIRVG